MFLYSYSPFVWLQLVEAAAAQAAAKRLTKKRRSMHQCVERFFHASVHFLLRQKTLGMTSTHAFQSRRTFVYEVFLGAGLR
jgi:hypothetical protein